MASPDGSSVWVAYNNGYVGRISTATNQLTAVVSVDPNGYNANTPADLNALAISPDGSTVWTADQASGALFSISTGTATLSPTTQNVGGGVAALAATSSFLYAANGFNGDLIPVQLSTGVVEPAIFLSGGTYNSSDPSSITISPGQTTAYVTTYQGNQVVPVTLSGPSGTGGAAGPPTVSGLDAPTGVVFGSALDPEAFLSSLGANPTTVPAGGAVTSTVTVTLTNGATPLAGHAVALTANSGSSALVAPHGSGTDPSVTDSNGQVPFLTSDTTAEQVTFTAKDLTTGITLVPTTKVTFGQAGSLAQVSPTPSANPVLVGNQVTYSVTVSSPTGSGPAPTGKVTFVDGNNSISSCILLDLSASDTQSCTVSYPADQVGDHTITVNYTGDLNYALTRSVPLYEAVTLATTSTEVAGDVNPVNAGSRVVYTATVTSDGSAPSGAVDFYDGTLKICPQVGLSGGSAQCPQTYDATQLGDHHITASYLGDTTHAPSGSNTWTETVQNLYGYPYVALGDSYSAGEGNGSYGWGSTTNYCDRSANAYPPLLDADSSLGSMKFVACSGAVTDDLFNPDARNGEPAQLCGAPGADTPGCPSVPWLGTSTTTVTLTIGGNDVGFSDVLQACVQAKFLKVFRFGDGKCLKDKHLDNQVKSRIKALAGQGTATTRYGRPIHPLAQVLAAIHAAAPNAHVYVAVYPALFGKFTGDCSVGTVYADNIPVIGRASLDAYVTRPNADSINKMGAALDQVIGGVTSRMGSWASVVNPTGRSYFGGHGFCDTGTSWFHPLAANATFPSTSPTYVVPASFHPDSTGQRDGFEAAFLAAGA